MNTPSHIHAISWYIATTFAVACADALARSLTSELPVIQVVCLGLLGAVIWLLPLVFKNGKRAVRTGCPKLQVLRALLELGGWFTAYTAVNLLPLPTFTALLFIHPLVLATVAVMVLKEETSRHHWIAMILGFAGVCIILQPDVEGYMRGMLYLLGTIACFSTCGVLIRLMGKTDTALTITFYMLLLTGLFALPLALPDWHDMNNAQLVKLACFSLALMITQFTVSKAIALAPFTVILPFSFCKLLFASVFAYVFFGEVVQPTTLLGGGIILGSAFYAFYTARQKMQGEERDLLE